MAATDFWLFISLVAARAIQFVATAIGCGGIVFILGILEPALSRSGTKVAAYPKLSQRLTLLTWAALTVLFLSAFCVLPLKSAEMSGAPLPEVVSSGILWTVLTQTDFGNAWTVRLALITLLVLTWARPTNATSQWPGATCVALALSVAGALAWIGHAHAGSGLQRGGHIASDVLHLIAAVAWLGALLPLAFTLQHSATGALPFKTARFVVLRFSNLGIISVAVLIISGVVNTIMIVDEPRALLENTYGRILLAKVSLFLVILALAALNRQRLTPRLASNDAPTAVCALSKNCVIEAALGGIILALVGALGILSPGDGG